MKVIFLDRDGTLNDDSGYLSDPNKLFLKKGVIEGLNLLKFANFQFIILTNQSGISRGLISEEELERIHARLRKILAKDALFIKKIYYCPDKDDKSLCRKPNSQMIYEALKDFSIDLDNSYIIGDRYRDILTGSSLKIPGILIKGNTINNGGQQPKNLIKEADSFLEAAQYVLQYESEKIWKSKIYYKAEKTFLQKINKLKQSKSRLVFTNGCFDLWHSGHLQYLAQAAQLGSDLIVGLNSDVSVQKIKGSHRPILSEKERAIKLAHLAFISMVIIFNEDTPIELIQQVRPDIHVKGGDYKAESLPEYTVLNQIKAQIIILPFKEGHSTSSIINRIYEEKST